MRVYHIYVMIDRKRLYYREGYGSDITWVSDKRRAEQYDFKEQAEAELPDMRRFRHKPALTYSVIEMHSYGELT